MQITSAQAYARNLASGLINGIRLLVYDAVNLNPDWTANEIHKLPELESYQLDSVRNRFAELEHAGVLASGNPRTCRITGNQAVTWALTTHVAVKSDFVKKKSRKDLEEELAESRRVNTELRLIAEDALRALTELENFAHVV